jgi:uncharacterized NAD(P)/FAD-binding protein YdhS
MTLALYPSHEVIDVRPGETGLRLTAKGLASGDHLQIAAAGVLLATGHWFPESGLRNYFDSPWPARRLLQSIPSGASVAVLGSSLSAIETALTLTSDGRFAGRSDTGLNYIPSKRPRKITLHSRGGLLPKVRGAVGERKNLFLTAAGIEKIRKTLNGRLTLKATFELLDSELASAYGRPVDWRTVLTPAGSPADALDRSLREAQTGDGPAGEVLWQTVLSEAFGFVRKWYLALAEGERRRFDRMYTSAFFAHAATQPHINAAKLLSLMRSGQVRVVTLGGRYRLRRDDTGDRYRLDYTNRNGHPVTDRYRYVVDARGQRRSMESNPSELAQNLLSSIGSAFKDGPAGRFIRIDPRTHQVVSGKPAKDGAIYAVGAMTRNQIIDASMAHGLCQSTAVVAERLLDSVASRRSG